MHFAMPLEMSRIRTESGGWVEIERFSVALHKASVERGAFFEAADGDLDEKVITFRYSSPEALVEHPVSIGGEG